MNDSTRAIALVSGGLDSILAARVLKDQGIEVLGVCFVMQFAAKDIEDFEENVKRSAGESGISVRFVDISGEFLEMMVSPEYGFGANMNPCIDCKILMLKTARRIMEKENADMVVTGEVLGERPMSQRRDALNAIRNRSGLKGYLLRPLSAKLMEETIPEKEGKVDRGRLLGLSGRGREAQFALAEKYGITKFFSPAGGCLLTDPGFAGRLKDLMARGELNKDDVDLLKFGRHFRIDEATKVIIGRTKGDNGHLLRRKKPTDLVLKMPDKPGPVGLLRGKITKGNIAMGAALVVSHSKFKKEKSVKVAFWTDIQSKEMLDVEPLDRDALEEMRI